MEINLNTHIALLLSFPQKQKSRSYSILRWLPTCVGITIVNILLISCSYIPTASLPKATSWDQHQKSINNLTVWHAIGKIGFTNGNQGGSASLDWQQKKNNFTLNLYGPFKTENIRITGKPGVIYLSTSDGIQQTANTPEEVIEKQLGWNVPVTGLIYWSKGIPIPGEPSDLIQLSKENRLTRLVQHGWNIEYHEYKAFDQFILPTKITLQYEKIKIKLIFKSWT